MFLIINKAGEIVLVCEAITHVKTQSNGATILAAAHDATAVYHAESDTFYSLREAGAEIYSVAEVETVPEGVPLAVLAYEDGAVTVDLEKLRSLKLTEVAEACRAAILAGCSVAFNEKRTENFALEESDQINLTAAATAVSQGAAGYPYHADGELCRLYPADEILMIAQAATAHKLYNTTYCNHILTWARRAESAEELAEIVYGAELPDDLAANLAEVMGNAAAL